MTTKKRKANQGTVILRFPLCFPVGSSVLVGDAGSVKAALPVGENLASGLIPAAFPSVLSDFPVS